VKKYRAFFAVLSLAGGMVFAEGLEFSGLLDSTVNYTAGAGGARAHSWGIEEYANIRLRARAGEKALFYAAFNLTALSGNFLETAAGLGTANNSRYPGLLATPFPGGENYAAAMELERLYFRINGEYLDAEAGLLRMAFGYGQVWGSSDFLKPRNPLSPDARPRGVLGTSFSFYPADDLKLQIFAAAPKNPLESEGRGIIPGFSIDRHWNRASLQALYAFETPLSGTEWGIHRFGISVKADLELGLVADALYTFNSADACGIDGLSLGAGFDYSFYDGKVYALAEYLFNGLFSATAGTAENPGFVNRHYLYGSVLYRLNDYASLSLAGIFCFDDISFSPVLTAEYEVFQGFTLSLSGRVPLDRDAFDSSSPGELGPVNSRARAVINAKARLRF
jgi:hypothetical protein